MKKLFKFEFFSVCRILVPVWCGTLLLSLLIGGLGILMVKKSMDAVDYAYEDGKNVLTIKKSI